MKIKALRSGKFAHPDPSARQVFLKEGEIEDYDDRMAASLIECGAGEVAVVHKSFNKMNKAELIKYAAENYISIDRLLTNGKMVEAIESAEAENG